MARITNAPRATLTLDLERRKSFAFRLNVKNADGGAVDLTGARIRFVLKPDAFDDDHYDVSNIVVNQDGSIPPNEGSKGYCVFGFQAAELDQPPGEYYGSIVMWTSTGYSVTLLKLVVNILENTESDSMHVSYVASAPPTEIEVALRGNQVVNVYTQNLGVEAVRRGPCVRTTEATIAPVLGAVTQLAISQVVPQAYTSGGQVELRPGDLIYQSNALGMVLGRVFSVGDINFQMTTILSDAGAYATAAQGTKADSAVQPEDLEEITETIGAKQNSADLPADVTNLVTFGGPVREALSSTYAAGADLAPVRHGDTYTAARPVLTFVDDDADPLFYDVWDVIADEKGVDISLAAIAGRVSGAVVIPGYPSMNLTQLRAIRAKGHDILNHAWEHLASYDAANTADELYTDWATAQAWYRTHFPEAVEAQEVLVYPGGLAATEVAKKGSARRLFRYGITTTATYNTTPVDNWAIQRINGDTLTEAQLKTAIDGTVAANGWLVVMTHDKELDAGGRAANMTKLRNVIDYARAQGVEILKFTDAEKVKGNAVAIGEFTDRPNSTFIARGGKRRHDHAQGTWTPRLYGSTTPGVHTYTQRKGYYQIVGGMVIAKASISITAANLDAAMAGNLRIDGLPAAAMPSALDVAGVAPVASYNIFNPGAGFTHISVKTSGTYLNMMTEGNNVAEKFLTNAHIVAGQTLNIAFTLTYMLAGDPVWT